MSWNAVCAAYDVLFEEAGPLASGDVVLEEGEWGRAVVHCKGDTHRAARTSCGVEGRAGCADLRRDGRTSDPKHLAQSV